MSPLPTSPAPDFPRREVALSADVPGLDLALPTVTLHYTPCLPPPTQPVSIPTGKKARGNRHLLVVE